MTKKTFLKENIPKILLIFSMFVIFTFVNINKVKAQENTENWVVVKSYDIEAGYVYFYEYDTNTLYKSIQYQNIYNKHDALPFTHNKNNIPTVFRLESAYSCASLFSTS